jgi:hypothetical protein
MESKKPKKESVMIHPRLSKEAYDKLIRMSEGSSRSITNLVDLIIREVDEDKYTRGS